MNSKEALERIKNWYVLQMTQGNEFLLRDNEEEMFNVIKQDLDRLELKEYENEQLYKNRERDHLIYSKLKEEKEKQDKILQIIKEKRVDIQLLKDSKNLNDYNWCVHTKDRALTKEEYDLLKEWFE